MNDTYLVILSTPTCIKCKSLVPKIEAFCKDTGISFLKKNAIDDGLDLVKEFNIKSVPTVILYKNGEPIVFKGDFDIDSIKKSLDE